MIDSVAGFINAAPAPCRTRAPISISDEVASPQRRDASVKRTIETAASVSHLRFASAKIPPRMHANPSQRVAADFAWSPSAKQLDAANVARLARALGCVDYRELHALSIDDPDRFWRAVVGDLEIPLARQWDA